MSWSQLSRGFGAGAGTLGVSTDYLAGKIEGRRIGVVGRRCGLASGGATTAAVIQHSGSNVEQDASIIHESSVWGYIYTRGAVGMPDMNYEAEVRCL